MAAIQLIKLIEDRGLLDPEVVVELRRQVADSKVRITPEAIVKLLVEGEYLTKFQATKLIASIKDGLEEATAKGGSSSGADELSIAEDDSLLPDDFVPKSKDKVVTSDQPQEAKWIDDAESVEMVDDDEDVEEVEVFDDEVVEVVEELDESDDVTEVVELVDDDTIEQVDKVEPAPTNRKRKRSREKVSSFEEDSSQMELDPAPPTQSSASPRPVRIEGPKTGDWDAFRIWGVGFGLSVLLALLTFLVYWLWVGSAGNVFDHAMEAYESRDYEVAIERFQGFVSSFGGNEKAGRAKVLKSIATLRQANDQLGDPMKAIDLEEEVLPAIANEPAMNELTLRSDLASAMVSIAEKLVQRAEGAKTTDDRQKLIDKLDQHLVLMKNPQYIPNAQRVTNESRMKVIDEERERLLRNVQRANDTSVAIDKMKSAVAAADVNAVYSLRREVVRKYPQLAVDKPLLELLQQATTIQKDAMKSATRMPKSIDPAQTTNIGRSVLLVKQTNGAASVAAETVLFIKAKGSVYALKGTDGSVIWRRYVGTESITEPIRMSDAPNADCIIVSPELGRVSRMSATDGATKWEIDLGMRMHQPLIDNEIIYVSSDDGNVYSIDGESGQVRWGKLLPQNISVGVGGGSNKPARYVVADNSSLYVLSKNDGSCKEVYYLGHSTGTISVPPVFALGQLLVFENEGPGYCKLRVLEVSEQGDALKENQTPIRLKGHVVIPPTIDGRRMVVMTDLGEVVAYDIESASNGDKVNKLAGIVANETSPRAFWPLVSGNDLWIVSNRFSRFQIQVSRQALVRDWVREDEDQFYGRPIKMEDYVVHARGVRGTQGVRVSAVQGNSGDPVWETDLGVPIVAVKTGSGSVQAINSQAGLFNITGKSMASGNALTPSENPGRNQRTLDFKEPVYLPNNSIALLNLNQGTQVVYYDPKSLAGSSLSMIQLQLTSGVPSVPPVLVGNGIATPLNNSQLAYFDPATGRQLGSPFQPTLNPEVATRWLTPCVLSDKQTLVAATDQKKIYRLSSGKQLKMLTEATTSLPLTQRLAAVGDVVAAVSRGESQDAIDIYNGLDLSKINAVDIDGRITWGPYATGDQFVAYSETSGLVGIDTQGKQTWKVEIDGLALIGEPLLQDDEMVISSKAGLVVLIEPKTGKLNGTVNLGEPLSGPPTELGTGLLFPGSEGALIAVTKDQFASGRVSKGSSE